MTVHKFIIDEVDGDLDVLNVYDAIEKMFLKGERIQHENPVLAQSLQLMLRDLKEKGVELGFKTSEMSLDEDMVNRVENGKSLLDTALKLAFEAGREKHHSAEISMMGDYLYKDFEHYKTELSKA